MAAHWRSMLGAFSTFRTTRALHTNIGTKLCGKATRSMHQSACLGESMQNRNYDNGETYCSGVLVLMHLILRNGGNTAALDQVRVGGVCGYGANGMQCCN